MMIKLDKKDRKILYQLDIDSRQSANQIGRKVGLPRSVVTYRLARLQEHGVTTNFYTLIDSMALGFIPIRIHIKFQYVTTEIVQEIIHYFSQVRHTTLVGLAEGFFNLSVVMDVRDIHDFYDAWQEAKKRYGFYFQNHTLSFFVSEMRFNQSYLLMDEAKKHHRETFSFIGKRSIGELDSIDAKILRAISCNATIKLVELSKELDISSVAIQYRMKKLIDNGVILGYKVNIDVTKIGYQKVKVYVYLKDFSNRAKIIEYIKYDHNLINIDTNTGESDLELEYVVENVEMLRSKMKDLIDTLPNVIKNYDIITHIQFYKYIYFPEYP
ncbi:MAG: Lrp/AsnC family transcriptional regulator [Thermoplasmatota archaeon]